VVVAPCVRVGRSMLADLVRPLVPRLVEPVPPALGRQLVRTRAGASPGVAAADMPPLFVRTGEGLELVNYRADGQAYVVDRVFDRAELRLGRKKPVVVRIDRKEAAGP